MIRTVCACSPIRAPSSFVIKMAAFREHIGNITEGQMNCEDDTDEKEIEDEIVGSKEENKGDGDEDGETEEVIEGIGQELESQGSVTFKRKGRAGRKPRWPEEYVKEIVQIICENEYYRRRLIFKNSKASKNLEIYAKIVNQAKAYLSKSGGYLEHFDFTPVQTRTKFKACVGICKKASMKRKCGSGITNFYG